MQTKISKNIKVILSLSIMFMLLTTSGYGLTRVLENDGKIVGGVIIKNINLGNQSKNELFSTLQQLEDGLNSKTIIFKCKNKQWSLTLRELGLKVDKERIFEDAFSIGRRGNWLEQLKDRKRISNNKQEIPLTISLNEKSLHTLLEKKAKKLRINPVNASYRITSNYKLILIPGKNGIDIDYVPLPGEIKEIVINDYTPEIDLKLKTIKPQINNQDILNMKVNGVVATFTTKFNASKVSRASNVTHGARTLDNVTIKPGETFSFNKTVGPRSKRNGYKEAPEIQNNTLVTGVGGGICQVSTTLFNAVLLANLPVIERSNHSIPVHYVPLGRDATVTYGGHDFKFKNNTDGYFVIKTITGKGYITFLLLGNTANKKRVDIEEKTLYEISSKKIIRKLDNTLYKGVQVVDQEPSSGYRIRVVQTVWSGSKVIKKVVFYSTYNPKAKIIRVGIKKRPIVTNVNNNSKNNVDTKPKTEA